LFRLLEELTAAAPVTSPGGDTDALDFPVKLDASISIGRKRWNYPDAEEINVELL
jgi:hypothetical protein